MSRTEGTFAANLTRRDVLRTGSAVLVVSAASACDLLSTDPAEDGDNARDASADTLESPMLADRVEAGDLPELAERLPDNPLVVEPTDRVGRHGGTGRVPLEGPTDPLVYLTLGYDGLVRWDENWEEVIPNLAEGIEVSDDARTYTVTLRPGLKWSDGKPFTSEDVLFAFDDVIGDEDITPTFPSWLTADGDPATAQAPDEYTVVITFPEPNGLFLERLATPDGNVLSAFQKEYFSQFHAAYNDDVEQLAQEEGFSDWVDLFAGKGGTVSGMVDSVYWQNSEVPTLCAWSLRTAIDEQSVTVAERNPYYGKTDPDGRQLPYLDEISFQIMESTETILLRAINGEVDIEDFWGPFELPNKPVFAENAESGDYRLIDVIPASMNHDAIALNLNHEDPVLREVFQNKDFRIGLSHAINRPEIIDAIYQRQGEPWQAAPREESGYFSEELARQYTEYDVDLANEHLDRAGYSELDNEGFRLGPDGDRISFRVETTSEQPEALELIQGYWEEVGVRMQIHSIARDLLYDRKSANQHDAVIWNGDGGMQDAIMDPRWYFPAHAGESNYALLWAQWYESGGSDGEEPPEPAREQMALYDELKQTGDRDDRRELFMQILQIAQTEFWAIGTVLPLGNYGIVPNSLHNVPEPVVRAWLKPNPGSTRPEQFFRE